MSIHTKFPICMGKVKRENNIHTHTHLHMKYEVHAFALSTDLLCFFFSLDSLATLCVWMCLCVCFRRRRCYCCFRWCSFFVAISSNSNRSRIERESERGVWRGHRSKRHHTEEGPSLWFTRWLEYQMRHKFRLQSLVRNERNYYYYWFEWNEQRTKSDQKYLYIFSNGSHG